MSKKIKYVFLLFGLFLSVLFFATGVHSVSYADERIDNKQTLQEDELQKVIFDYDKRPVFSIDSDDLPCYRGLSDFSNYYNSFDFSSLPGNYLKLLFENDTTFNEINNHFYSITGNYLQNGNNDINLTNIGLSCYNSFSGSSNIVSKINTVRFSVSGTTVTITFRGVVDGLSSSLTVYTFSNSNVTLSNFCFIYINTISSLSNNNLLTINNFDLNCLFSVLMPDVSVVDDNLVIDFSVYRYYRSNISFFRYNPVNILINSYSSVSEYNSYPINIDVSYNTTYSISDLLTEDQQYTNLITIPLSSLSDVGNGYCLHFSIQMFVINSDCLGSSISYYFNSLPFIYDFGSLIVLDAPVLILNNGILSWTDVANADYYLLKRTVDDTEYFTNLSNNILSYVVSVNGNYSIQSCSYNSSEFVNSSYSNVVPITYFADTEYSFLLLFSSITDSILMLFKSFLNYSIFGINLFGAFGVLLFILLCLAILKFLRFNG